MCYDLMKPRLNFLAIILKGMFGTKTTLHITKGTPYPQWSMVVAASRFGAVFSSAGTGALIKVEELWTVPNNQSILAQNLQASAESWRWRGTSSFSTITTQSIHLNQQKNGFTRIRLKFWNGPARAQTWIWLKICGVIWRGLCTGDVLAIWQIWSVFAMKSGQILHCQDVSCW